MKMKQLAAIVSTCAVAVGCAASNSSDGPVDEAKQDFSNYGFWSWGTVGYDPPAVDMGTDPQTCFLSGVNGVLTASAPLGTGYLSYARTMLLTEPYGGVPAGHWALVNTALPGDMMGAQVVCLPTATNRTAEVAWENQDGTLGPIPAQVLAPYVATHQTVCGLTAVMNYGDSPAEGPNWRPNQWTSAGDAVYIWHDSANWYIGGLGHAYGIGRCVDVDDVVVSGEFFEGTAGTTTTDYFLPAVPNRGTSPLGTQCFLSGIAGSFQDNSSWTDGVFVAYNTGNESWGITIANDKSGWVTCVQ